MGRKPKYDKAMTSAEKSREYRARKKDAGKSQIYFSISAGMLSQLDELVDFFNLPGRAEVVSDLMSFPIVHALRVMNEMKSNPDVPMNLGDDPDDSELIKQLKTITWNAIVEEPSDELKTRIKEWEQQQ